MTWHQNLFALKQLLAAHPVVLPFKDSNEGIDLLTICQDMVRHMVCKLKELYQTKQDVGGYAASWQAYQLELALESFFFGDPLSLSD